MRELRNDRARDAHVLQDLRPGGTVKCWDCDNSHMHSDGAVFCKLYAARVKEEDEPLPNCTKFTRRTGPLQRGSKPPRAPAPEE